MNGAYYQTKESVDEYIKMAEGINGKQLIEQLERILQPTSTVLELGSGPGSDWEILSNAYRVVGSDNSREFLRQLVAKHPKGEFLELDATTLLTENTFDGIYSNKVLHHLQDSELERSIKRQHEILAPKGIVCHSFWKGEGSEIFKGLFVNYQNEESLKVFFGKYFEVLSIDCYAEFEDGDSLLFLGRKK